MRVDPSSIRVVGGDGGGTRLRLALADGAGRILSRRMGPPGLVEPGGEARVAARITDEVTALAREVGAPLPVDAICIGLAGVGRTERAEAVRSALEAAGVARRVQVVTDAAVALRDAFGAGVGILLIAGTGSVALARRPDGEIGRAGGWGSLLGDEGSGYRLGLEGLRAGLRGRDGRGPVTALATELAGALRGGLGEGASRAGAGAAGERSKGVGAGAGDGDGAGAGAGGTGTPEGLLTWAERAGKGQVAALAPHVIRLAQEGDGVARTLVEQALADLVAHVEALREWAASSLAVDGGGPKGGMAAVARGADGGKEVRGAVDGGAVIPVALSGGLLSPGGPLRDAILALLTARGIPVREGPVDAARGAVAMALEGVSI